MIRIKFMVGVITAFALVIALGDGFAGEFKYLPGAAFIAVFPEVEVAEVKPGADRLGVAAVDRLLAAVGTYSVARTFPDCLPPKPGGADLTVVYTIRFPESVGVWDFCADLEKLAEIDFAVPWQLHETYLEHNDPHRGNQYGLDLCQANLAHDISTGSRDAVVGIVDTGVDIDHPDLIGNLWINPGEDLNGNGAIDDNERNNRDDDGNGRVDDFYGWDFVDNDNNPDDRDGHGTHVAGIASAVTNNRIGVASVGYSCAILSVRTGTNGVIQYGYQGIEYAVRAGAHVVNCSWGGAGGNAFAQRVIDYAYQNDVLVIAAAGNDNQDAMFNPAGYENTVAVAATDDRDRRANFSNYGAWVDISAPGVAVRSTYPNNRYADLSGTSMASPFTAGVAILIRAAYPNINVDDVRALLIDGADPIDDENPNFRGRLGSGRINAYESLLLGARPLLAVDTLIIDLDDNDNGRLDPGETANITITVTNGEFGEPAEDVNVVLSCSDAAIQIDQPLLNFPDLEPGESFTNEDEPFEVTVPEDLLAKTIWFTVTVLAQPADVHIERQFEMVVGHPHILIVDDDDGDVLDSAYYRMVEEIHQGWVRWNVAREFSPSAEVLTDYDMVIWHTGNSAEPLDDLDRWQLQDALSRGANVLLIGKNISDDPANEDIMLTGFGARHDQDSVFAMLAIGTQDGAVPADEQLLLAGGGVDARSSPSSLTPTRGADTLLIYSRGQGALGIAGVSWIEPRSGAKRAFIGFTLESASDRFTRRSEILEYIFNWFMAEPESAPGSDPIPQIISLSPAFPNPFNGLVTLDFNLPHSGTARLAVFDITGREVVKLADGRLSAGGHRAVWDAGNAPSGVYIARLTASGGAAIERRLTLTK